MEIIKRQLFQVLKASTGMRIYNGKRVLGKTLVLPLKVDPSTYSEISEEEAERLLNGEIDNSTLPLEEPTIVEEDIRERETVTIEEEEVGELVINGDGGISFQPTEEEAIASDMANPESDFKLFHEGTDEEDLKYLDEEMMGVIQEDNEEEDDEDGEIF